MSLAVEVTFKKVGEIQVNDRATSNSLLLASSPTIYNPSDPIAYQYQGYIQNHFLWVPNYDFPNLSPDGDPATKGSIDATFEGYIHLEPQFIAPRNLLSKGGPGWGATGSGLQQQGFLLRIEPDTRELLFQAGNLAIDGWAGYFSQKTLNPLPNDGEWHHWRVTIQSNQVYISIDGVAQTLVETSSQPSAPDLSTCRMFSPALAFAVGSGNGRGANGEVVASVDGTGRNYSLDLLRFYIGSALPPGNHALPTVNTLPLSGVATALQQGGIAPVQKVIVRDWLTHYHVAAVEPDLDGNWSVSVPPGQYDVTYIAPECAPVIHGPYEVVEA